MKLRNDFVSNSSSTSFIISAEDNAYMMILNNPTLLTLKEFIDKFGLREFNLTISHYDKHNLTYVDDDIFIKQFGSSKNFLSYNIYPYSLKDYLNELQAFSDNYYINKNHCIREDKYYASYCNFINTYTEIILSKITDMLMTKYDNMMFAYQEIEDNWLGNVYDKKTIANKDYHDKDVQESRKYEVYYSKLDYESEESLIISRIEYMDKLKPLKFYRTYSNH